MNLLEKTRRLNNVMQRSDVQFKEIVKALSDLIVSNIYFVDNEGVIYAYQLQSEYECNLMRDEVFAVGKFPEGYMDNISTIRESRVNVHNENNECSFIPNTKCMFMGKSSTIVPVYANNVRIGTLIAAKYNDTFTDDDVLLLEIASTVLGMLVIQQREKEMMELERQKVTMQVAFSTLSFSEMEAVTNILSELNGNEGLLVASKIADRVGLTRSVIVNALRKFESAGLIETKSLGMKGTYIKVINSMLFEELQKNKH